MIKLELIGTIGKDAVSQIINNNNYAKFSLAIRDGKDLAGNFKTIWVEVLKLDKEGKLTPHLTAKTIVQVEGNPKVNAYQNKKGEIVGELRMFANSLEIIHSPKKEVTATVQDVIPADSEGVDDLPFN